MKVIRLAAATLALLFFTASANANLYRESYYAPYNWRHGPPGELTVNSLPSSQHPLKEAGELFRMMRGDALGDAREFADALILKYSLLSAPLPTLVYPEPHAPMPAGWYSGMGNFMMVFLLLDLGDQSGDPRYATAALNLFNSSIREMRDGGVVIRGDGGCHLVEYAHPDVPYDEVIFVLNGHLLALQSLLILQNHPETSDAAKDLYECGRRKTEMISGAFHSKSYAYYQLNPVRANMISYLMFETMQFRALYEMSGNQFYAEEAAYRESLFKKAYPIVYKSDNGGYDYLVSMLSFPHPYIIPKATLECTGAGTGNVYKADNRNDESILTKTFIRISAAEKLENCSLTSDYEYGYVELYQDADGGKEVADDPLALVPFTIKAHNDSALREEKLVIDPNIMTDGKYSALAIVQLLFDEPVEVSDSDLIMLKVCTENPIFHPTIRIGDAEGNVIARNWPPIDGAKCKLAIFSVVGFHDQDTADFSKLGQIGFTTGTAKSAAYTIDKIEIGVIRNAFQAESILAMPEHAF